MTRVYCTKKLKDFIGHVEETLPDDYNDIKLTDWNAHLFFVDKRKCLVFVNILTYYVVFIADIVKKDMKNIDEIFRIKLLEQLILDKIITDVKDTMVLTSGEGIRFIKTNNNKKAIGRTNDFVDTFKAHCYIKYAHLKEMNVAYENWLMNETPTGKYTDTRKTWTSPKENMRERLKGI